MKKSLLALAACAMMAGTTDAALYLVGQPAGEWSPMVGIEMEEVDGGYKWTGTVASDEYFAFATQLLESNDWDTFNAEYRLSPEANGTVASDGEYALHFGAPDAAFRGMGDEEVTYFVKEVDGVYTLTVSGAGEAPEPTNDTWAVIGAFNGWAEDYPMTQIREGVWKATMYNFSGDFKFRANGAWELNYGVATDDVLEIEVDGDYEVALNGCNFNIPEEVEEVVFELDVNNKTLTVDGLTPSMLALRGSFIDWEFEWSYLFQEVETDVYMLYLDGVDSDWQFKIADQDWKEIYTTSVPDMKAGEIYPIDPDNAANMGVDNVYTEVTMVLNLEDGYFCFYGEVGTGVATAEIADGKARYFNLQGCEVSNPSNGVFIRVVNGKSEKITVK